MKKNLYLYINDTKKLQIIRINNIESLHFERVIFPGQRLLFEAVQEAKLEVQIDKSLSVIIPCYKILCTEIVTTEKSLKEFANQTV